MSIKKIAAAFLAAALTLSLSVFPSFAESETTDADLSGKTVILHTNDTHGYDDVSEGKQLGMAGMAAIKADYEKRGAEVILVDAGDFSQGDLLANFFQGENCVRYMNETGYDLATVGNHEFDYGLDNLAKLEKAANFEIICANVISKQDGKPLFRENSIITTKSGKKIGFFGLVTPGTYTSTNPENVKGLEFLDGEKLVKCAQEQTDYLKAQGCTLVVALSHIGDVSNSGSVTSIEIAEKVKGIDLIVDGHSHTLFENGKQVGDTLIASTGSYCANMGVVTYDSASKKLSAAVISAKDYNGKYDDTVNADVSKDKVEIDKAYAEVIAKNTVTLVGEREDVRTSETNLGDLIADGLFTVAHKKTGITLDGAIMNGGSIRITLRPGDISMEDIKRVLPYANQLCVIEVKGTQLLEALEAASQSTPVPIGAFAQVAGIEYSINTAVEYAKGEQYPDSTNFAPAKPGSRVTIKSVGGKAFNPNADYKLAVSEYLVNGGDTYYVFKNEKLLCYAGCTDDEAVIEYIKSDLGGTIGDKYAESAGRITFIDNKNTETAPVQTAPETSAAETTPNPATGGRTGVITVVSAAMLALFILTRKKRG